MVEIKAINKLELSHIVQARNYLEAYNLEVGLLINFGGMSLEFGFKFKVPSKLIIHNIQKSL